MIMFGTLQASLINMLKGWPFVYILIMPSVRGQRSERSDTINYPDIFAYFESGQLVRSSEM